MGGDNICFLYLDLLKSAEAAVAGRKSDAVGRKRKRDNP